MWSASESGEVGEVIIVEIGDDPASVVEALGLPRHELVVVKEDLAGVGRPGRAGQGHHLVKLLSNLTKPSLVVYTFFRNYA